MLTKLTVWFDRTFGRSSYRMHVAVYRHSRGWVGHRSMAGPMLLLTTVGRKSGLERTNPLLYMPDGESFVVVGSNGGRPQPPAWVLNLTAQPRVDIRVGRRTMRAEAHVLSAEEAAAIWPRLTEHYKGWGTYRTMVERELKVIRLVPVPVAQLAG